MSLGLYMDIHVPLPITRGLRRRGPVAVNPFSATDTLREVLNSLNQILAQRNRAGHSISMTAGTPTVPVTEPNSQHRFAIRAARHLKAQVEDWYDECRALTDWEDKNLVDDPTPERLAEHARLLEELERVGRWLESATQSADFPDRPTADLVVLTLRCLADRRAMWHGRSLTERQRAEILQACFNES